MDCVKLSVTAVVIGVVAALRRIIGPFRTFPHVAFATTVGTVKHQGRKFFYIHEKVHHVSFRFQQGLYRVDPLEIS